MSSTHMKMMIALRRVSTPMAPIVNSTAERASDSASIDLLPAPDHDGADDGHEQQDARQLEREQVLGEERLGHAADGAEIADRDRVVAAAGGERLGETPAGQRHH